MLKRKIRTLTVTGIMIVAAALVTLSTTAASAAPMTASAPGHVAAPRAAAATEATGCVTEDFSEADEGTYEPCVLDEQVLLNDVYDAHDVGPNQLLATDGYYGPDTTSDVTSFQKAWDLEVDGITGPQTWDQLCVLDYELGYRGTYWHNAGCASEPGL
jgi:peptidoglycan hydrolase-like protein with peptidoglycan-binding domain